MKKLLFLVTVLFFFTNTSSAFAVSPTPAKSKTASPSANKEGLDEKLNEQINNLKEKIASRVSELNLVERRGMIGVVTEVSTNKITVKDSAGKIRVVDVDELTKFSSGGTKTFGLSDITKGSRVSILGIYNKQSKRLLARFIRLSVDPTVFNGTISAVDNKNFAITITTEDEKQHRIDIQTTTKILGYEGSGELTKLGFSKIHVGDRATTIGFPDKKDATLLVASRFIDLAGLPKNPKIIIEQSSASPSASVTKTP